MGFRSRITAYQRLAPSYPHRACSLHYQRHSTGKPNHSSHLATNLAVSAASHPPLLPAPQDPSSTELIWPGLACPPVILAARSCPALHDRENLWTRPGLQTIRQRVRHPSPVPKFAEIREYPPADSLIFCGTTTVARDVASKRSNAQARTLATPVRSARFRASLTALTKRFSSLEGMLPKPSTLRLGLVWCS